MHRINFMYVACSFSRDVHSLALQLYMQCTLHTDSVRNKAIDFDHDHDEIKSKVER